MNERQQAICDKFSLFPVLHEDYAYADFILTPQGRLYELDDEHDPKLPGGDYVPTSPERREFLCNLGVVWVKSKVRQTEFGVPIEV
jgi:hypothetical protein